MWLIWFIPTIYILLIGSCYAITERYDIINDDTDRAILSAFWPIMVIYAMCRLGVYITTRIMEIKLPKINIKR